MFDIDLVEPVKRQTNLPSGEYRRHDHVITAITDGLLSRRLASELLDVTTFF